MCAHFENIREGRVLREAFGAAPLSAALEATVRSDVWPGYLGTFIIRAEQAEAGDEAPGSRIAQAGVFGLLPHWARDEKLARHTYNARSETVAEKPSFRDAWRRARHCIVPAQAIYEPDWRSGKAQPARIHRADGHPMGLAGLWDRWRHPQGHWLLSFTLLTINADAHPFMNQYHRPGDEKRMVVVLPESRYDDWLQSDAERARPLLQPWPADGLVQAEGRPPR